MSYTSWPKPEKLNWDNVDASRTPPPLPRWLYCGEIVKAERGLTGENSKNPGQPKVTVQLSIAESYEDAVDVGSGRRRLTETLTFVESAMFRPKQLCEAMGLEPPASTSEDDLDEWIEQLVGENVWFIMSRREETYQGEKSIRNRVEAFVTEAELEEIAGSMQPPDGEVVAKPSKAKGRGRSANGASRASGREAPARTGGRRGREAVEEMDTDDEADDEADETEEAEAPAEAAPRRRGRPPKGASARR